MTWCSSLTSLVCHPPSSAPLFSSSSDCANGGHSSPPNVFVASCSAPPAAATCSSALQEKDDLGPPGAGLEDCQGKGIRTNYSILPFSNSPVLQRELSSNASAAMELRFFPYDDPACGRHRPYVPDHLELFLNPPFRTAAPYQPGQALGSTTRAARSPPPSAHAPSHMRRPTSCSSLSQRRKEGFGDELKTEDLSSLSCRRDTPKDANSWFLPYKLPGK